MQQKTVPNISSPEGRKIYVEYLHDLAKVQQISAIIFLPRLWLTACFGKEINIQNNDTNYSISHALGLRLGTRVFMEEIISKHYFNAVQALVYFGAVIMLIFLAMRFAGIISEEISLIGIIIEAFMLITLASVIYYSKDEPTTELEQEDNDEGLIKEMLQELEEIGSQYATLGIKIENAVKTQSENMRELTNKVAQIQGLQELSSHSIELKTTNSLLQQLIVSIDELNKKVDLISTKEIEYKVREEIQKIVNSSISK